MANESGNPSFLTSTWEGAKGAIKGMLAGGTFGALVGAATGAIIGALTNGNAIEGARIGAEILGTMFASIGMTAGTVTSVVKNRDSGKVSIEDAVKAVQVSMAQGMAVEQLRQQAMDSKWADKIAAERKQPTIDTGQRLHS